jgi:hypothetical protein
MKHEDIIKLAQEAGYEDLTTVRLAYQGFDIKRFANLITEREREACAKAAFYGYYIDLDGEEISASIRARSNHD